MGFAGSTYGTNGSNFTPTSDALEKCRVFWLVRQLYLETFPEPGSSPWMNLLMSQLEYAYRSALSHLTAEEAKTVMDASNDAELAYQRGKQTEAT